MSLYWPTVPFTEKCLWDTAYKSGGKQKCTLHTFVPVWTLTVFSALGKMKSLKKTQSSDKDFLKTLLLYV